jgi:dTDP-4-dehydrorhamnose 3,5-epimerase-like enzyme
MNVKELARLREMGRRTAVRGKQAPQLDSGGVAHGFLVLSDFADVLYEAGDYYAPDHERCVLWSDPDIGIEWPLAEEPVLTVRDRAGQRLGDAETYP